MSKMFCFCKVLLVFFFIIFYFAQVGITKRIHAFSEDFASDPRDSSNWDVQNSSGLEFDSPGITLSSNNFGSFPYLKTTESTNISSDKYYEIRFQYIQTGSPWGVGASFTDNAPNYPTYLGTIADYLNYNVAYFFGEKLHVVTSLCPTISTTCPSNWWFIYPNLSPENSYYPSTAPDYSTHVFSMLRVDSNVNTYRYRVYLDSKLIFESQDTSRLVNTIWLGHPSDLGESKNWPILKIFSVKTFPEPPVPVPTSTPTPSPRPSPTPNQFPYFSQKDPLWGSHTYDSAAEWAGADKVGIERWGCAVTSVAMVLRSYGVKSLDGSEVNPGKLNTWLRSQSDGYIGPGLLNWLAITRYVRQSYEAGRSETKLEFARSYSTADLALPTILGVPGHFVVAHGEEDADSWKINDPANSTRTTMSKASAIVSINRFVPSHTDLSYMLFVTKPGMSIDLLNSDNISVPLNWLNEHIYDDIDGALSSSTVLTGLVSKPADDVYILHVQNNEVNNGTLVAYLYDVNGNFVQDSLSIPGKIGADFTIHYSKNPGASGSIALDYASIFSYIRSLRVPKSPANGIFEVLYARFTELTRSLTSSSNLSRFIAQQSPKHVPKEVKAKLQNYIMLIQQN